MANSIVVKNAVLQPSFERELKHNHRRLFFLSVSLFLVRWKQKSQQHHSALQKLMSVLRQCERPYLELLGSEGKRKRHRVKQRGRQGGGTDKYISNILMSKTVWNVCGVKGRGRRSDADRAQSRSTSARTSPSSSSTSKKSKSRKTRNCCSLAVSSRVSSLVPPSSDDTPLSRTSIMSRSPHDEKITWGDVERADCVNRSS